MNKFEVLLVVKLIAADRKRRVVSKSVQLPLAPFVDLCIDDVAPEAFRVKTVECSAVSGRIICTGENSFGSPYIDIDDIVDNYLRAGWDIKSNLMYRG